MLSQTLEIPASKAGSEEAAQFRLHALIACALLVFVAGFVGIGPIVVELVSLWIDPLRSLGMLFPIVSILLIGRAWRSLGWRADGNLWGFGLLLATLAISLFHTAYLLELSVYPSGNIDFKFLPFCYGCAFVLMLGGTSLFRRSLFPLGLLLFVNPVPHKFTTLVDLPLQIASAGVTRHFAALIGLHTTTKQLQLMFTPDFGLFIAPGCNGVRGATTLAYLAVIVGSVRRVRALPLAFATFAALLLGYLLNLLRLCTLMVYYRLALHSVWAQRASTATWADYIIGAVIFFSGASLMASVISHLPVNFPPPAEPVHTPSQHQFSVALARLGSFAGLCLLASIPYFIMPSKVAAEGAPVVINAQGYTLLKTWTEENTGYPTYFWTDLKAKDATAVDVGVTPLSSVPVWHPTALCRRLKGLVTTGESEIDATSADSRPLRFQTDLYQADGRRWLEANTLCDMTHCSLNGFSTGTVIIARERRSLVHANQMPMLIKIDLGADTDSTSAAAARGAQQLQAISKSLRLTDIVPAAGY